MRFYFILFLLVILTGCAGGYGQFYHAYVDPALDPELELLTDGADPQIFGSDNIERDALTLRAKKYVTIGYSSFNGALEDTENAVKQAKKVGASIVLVNSKYTNTKTNTSVMFLPDNKTTYHSGSVSGNTQNSGGGSSNTAGTYSGTSTTYGTKAVPYTSVQRRFDQTALYFVKNTRTYKFGFHYEDLTPQNRKRLERNTGVLITVVIEGTPAFYANILTDDVLIEVDNQLIRNIGHVKQLMGSISPEKESSTLTVIRNGSRQDIKVQF